MERALFRALRPVVGRHRRLLLAMLGAGFVAALAEGVGLALFIPLFYSLDPGAGGSASRMTALLDAVFGGVPPEHRLPVVAGAILGALLLKNAIVFANSLLYSRAYERIGHDLRMGIVSAWLHGPLDRLERRFGGTLLDTLKTQSWIGIRATLDVVTLAIHLLTLLVFGTVLLLISWQLTLGVTAALLVFTAFVQFVTRHVDRLSAESVETHERLSVQMLDLVRGMRTIRLFGREEDARARFGAVSKALGRVHFRRDVRAHAIPPLTETLVSGLLLVVLLLTARHAMELATVLTFLVVLYRMYPHLRHANDLRFQLRDALAPVQAVAAAVTSAPPPPAPGRPPERLREAITFDRVAFRYGDGEPPVLRDVSLSIPFGQTTALVGPSGGGKSTLLHLLLRLFEPTSGSIRVDGAPLAELDAAAWRRRIAVVSQDVYLFHGTIRENIAFGRPDATAAEIVEAARQASAHDFIEALPEGYDTLVGDGGLRLSGGQRQRLALARAFVRKPDLYVLDEATNALDSLSEEAIRSAIAGLPRPQTVLVVAHRLNTIADADQVIVLEQGAVAQAGSVGALLEAEGLFRRLVQLQQV